MRKASLAHTKAHLSEIVDDAEHRARSTVILRHGKPAAVIVPVDVAIPSKPPARRTSSAAALRSVRRFIEEFSAADPKTSAAEDLRRGRR